VKLTIQLSILSAANIGLAFVFQWYVFTQLGPGVETDALFAGMTIPQLVLAIISGSLMHVLVPLLSGENEDRRRHDAWGFLVLVGGLFTLLAITLYITAPWWVPITVPGFDESSQALTITLTRIQLIGMVFTAINGVQYAVYHAREQFLWAEFSPFLISAFALLLLIWALPRFGVIAAAWIFTFRMGMQTLLLSRGMGRPVFPDLKTPAIMQAWQRIKPLLIGTAYYKTDPMVDRFLLSSASSGSLSLYYLAQQIFNAVSQVINKSIVVMLVPKLSMAHKAGDKASFQRIYYQKLILIAVISLLGLLVLGTVGENILGLLIGHGNVTVSNVNELWWVMVWLSGMFFGGVVGQATSAAFYSTGDTVTPSYVSIFTYTIYIPFKVLSFYFAGIAGMAITTSFYYLVNLFLLFYLFKKKSK